MERNVGIREDPSLLLKDCRTVISLAYPYSSQKPSTADGLTVSRYSEPDHEDYHYRLKRLCKEITDLIQDIHGGGGTRICVDSAPILERSIAYSSGIGFFGKNNTLIIPDFGSYFFLAEILTTAPLKIPEAETMESRCGSCRLCIDSCPTRALERPFCINAAECLSYRTIELRDPVNEADGRKMGDCFFGCDKCQEVCPFNGEEEFKKTSLPPAEEFLRMEEENFEERFGRTSLARAGLEKIKTNIRAILVGNS